MVTVLLSVFNGEKWLEDCILSILNQTFKDFEFLIIDDGSNDGSLEIIKNFYNLDKRIRYITQKNIGLTKSLNKGINLAKGEWIARIDADDIALPNRLYLQLKYAKKNNLSLVGCQSQIIDPKGKIKYRVKVPCDHKNLYINLQKQKRFFSHSSALFKKSIVINLGGYREIMEKAQDYDLWLRIAEVSKIGAINYIGILLREHDSRISYISNGLDQRKFAHYANIAHIIRKSFPNYKDPLDYSCNLKIEEFKEFVNNILANTGTLEFYKTLYIYNKKVNKVNFLLRFLSIPYYFNNLQLLKTLFFWKNNGDFVSNKIAKSWIKNLDN